MQHIRFTLEPGPRMKVARAVECTVQTVFRQTFLMVIIKMRNIYSSSGVLVVVLVVLVVVVVQ